MTCGVCLSAHFIFMMKALVHIHCVSMFQDLADDLSRIPGLQATQPSLLGSPSIPLVARVYLQLGTWQWALSPGLDNDAIEGIQLNSLCVCVWVGVWVCLSFYFSLSLDCMLALICFIFL